MKMSLISLFVEIFVSQGIFILYRFKNYCKLGMAKDFLYILFILRNISVIRFSKGYGMRNVRKKILKISNLDRKISEISNVKLIWNSRLKFQNLTNSSVTRPIERHLCMVFFWNIKGDGPEFLVLVTRKWPSFARSFRKYLLLNFMKHG